MELTISAYREKVVKRLEIAQAEVFKMQEQLQLLDSIVQEEAGGESAPSLPIATSVIRRPIRTHTRNQNKDKDKDNEIAKSIRKVFSDTAVGDLIDVTTVVSAVQPKFPNISKDDLGRRASNMARRLAKKGTIKIEKEGSGRTPHTYKRVS